MTVYLNQSPRTPKRRLTGAACVVVTPFIRASSGGADAFARRRIHPSSTSRDVLDAPSRASNAPKHFFASNDRLRASRRASRRATTTDVRRRRTKPGSRHSHARDGRSRRATASAARGASTRAKHRSTRAREMAFSERHAARATGNAAIAGALLTFCGAAYWYTVMKVRKDEMDVAIERREAKAKGAR